MQKVKFKYDYCKNTKRGRLSTTVNQVLLDEFHKIKNQTGLEMSLLIEVAFYDVFKSQENVDEFFRKVKSYNGFHEKIE
jgi:hypothetical protein